MASLPFGELNELKIRKPVIGSRRPGFDFSAFRGLISNFVIINQGPGHRLLILGRLLPVSLYPSAKAVSEI